MFFKELVEKTEKLTNYNSYGEIFMTQSILLKWNEISFSLKVIRLIVKSSIWPILSTSLMVSFGIQQNCLVSLPETKTPITFSFPRNKSILISCKWRLMPFREDSSSRILDTASLNLANPVRDTLISTNAQKKRGSGQLDSKLFLTSFAAYTMASKKEMILFSVKAYLLFTKCSQLCRDLYLDHLSWWTGILSIIGFVMNVRCFPFLQKNGHRLRRVATCFDVMYAKLKLPT